MLEVSKILIVVRLSKRILYVIQFFVEDIYLFSSINTRHMTHVYYTCMLFDTDEFADAARCATANLRSTY